jgi:hypothetical protein
MAQLKTTDLVKRLCPSNALVDAMEAFLQTHYPSRRRPVVAAATLAMVVELHHRGEPFPARHIAAEALQCSVFGIDAALSVAMARDLVTIETKILKGNVGARDSVIRERYLIPSPELQEIGSNARFRRQKPAAA